MGPARRGAGHGACRQRFALRLYVVHPVQPAPGAARRPQECCTAI
ncbi:hypothetical protein [Azospirillum largimobile]